MYTIYYTCHELFLILDHSLDTLAFLLKGLMVICLNRSKEPSLQSEATELYYNMTSTVKVPVSAQNIGGKGFAIGKIEKRDQVPDIIQKS